MPLPTLLPSPLRYSVRLDHSHSEEIRLRDLRARQSTLPTTPVVTTGRKNRISGGSVQGRNTPLPTSDCVGTAPPGFIGRTSSAPVGSSDAAEDAFPAESDPKGAATHCHDRLRVQSAPASDQGGGGSGTTSGGRKSHPSNDVDPWRRRWNHHDVSPRAEEVIHFGIEQVVVPRFSSSSPLTYNNASSTIRQSSSFAQLSTARGSGSPTLQPQQLSRTSTLSGLGSGSGSGSRPRSQLAAVRAEREAIEAEARQAMARATPNLFPEICMAPPAAGGGGSCDEMIAGRRGWLAEVESKSSSAVNRQ